MTSIESIIDRQLKRWEFQKLMAAKEAARKQRFRPVITISRTLGARGEEIGSRMAELTGFHLTDREILDAIASDFGIQSKIVELFDETTRSELESWFDGIIRGRIIDSSDYLKSLAKTIGSIMRHGETILMGRGANIIIGPGRGFHVRVVAPLAKRIARISEERNITDDEAEKLITENDIRQAKFIKKSFGVDIDDPVPYDLVLNSDMIDIDGAAELALLAYGKKERVLAR
ncbi:MAG: cytidylate kinase-like family protein [candidate division Zixibacteria bacterium]